jgi:DNA-cytosine methyltransferase
MQKTDEIKARVGTRVKELRTNRGLTQEDFAKVVGWDKTYLCRVESGKQNITIENITLLCSALKINLKDFFGPVDSETALSAEAQNNGQAKPLRIFEGFAGYGGGSFALKRVQENNPNFSYKVVGYSEIDPWASELFDANHKGPNGKPLKNFSDITKIDPNSKDFPDFDMFTGGFPCQPFSSAGMQKGINDPYGRGTMFQHIIRICAVKKPRYILMENVKGLLSKKFDSTRAQMMNMLRDLGYVANKDDPNESPLAMALLNSKDYGVPQNRERVWMFARLGGLPKGFSMVPPLQQNDLRLGDFLDPKGYVPKELYLSKKQIDHLKEKHHIPSFMVDRPLCFDVYNKKIKQDGYSITITMPEHNSLRVIEPNKDHEVVRKMSVTEQFRLMGLEGLKIPGRKVDIVFDGQSYCQLSKRAGNGWDVNLLSILLKYIFSQLKDIDSDILTF